MYGNVYKWCQDSAYQDCKEGVIEDSCEPATGLLHVMLTRTPPVIPAQAGIQRRGITLTMEWLNPRLRGGDI